MIQENSIKIGKMFKALLSLALTTMLILCLQATVFAASPASTDTVLTINVPLNAESSNSGDGEPDTHIVLQEPVWVWHPISVVNEELNGFNAVRRTYALPPDVNPAVISMDDFEMFGQRFAFAYVIQQPTSNESLMEMRESVTIEARSRNLNDILPLLEQEIWFDRDGFAGTLVLDLHSITSEAAGTSRHTGTATRQRTFPHLSAADSSLIPRTITDGGTTFHLYNVNWQSSSMSAVDGHSVASNFTAYATYTAQVTQTRTLGYTITAEYVGTVFRTTPGKTLFTAIFYGEPIVEIQFEEPAQEPSTMEPEVPLEPTPAPGSNNAVTAALAIIGILLALGVVGAGGFFLTKHFLGYNATVYSINSPREIVKAGKIKLDFESPEPTIILDKIIEHDTAKTDRYVIQVSQRAMPKLINKVVRVVLHDKEAFHKVSEKALGMPVYEFEVNFSDDEGDRL